MATLFSPGVAVAEIDLSGYVASVATTGAVLAGAATWGPASVRTPIGSERILVATFGEPDNDTANDFFTASSFLSYGNNLNFVRVLAADARNSAVVNDGVSEVIITNPGVGYTHIPTLVPSSGTATATATVGGGEITSVTVTSAGSGYNIDSPPTWTVTPTSGDTPSVVAVLNSFVGVKILNDTDYENNYASGQAGSIGEWVGKFAGALGNGIQVFICDSPAQYTTWAYKGYFTGAPGTSTYVSNLGGSLDQMHIAVVDNLGIISGQPGTVLETYAFVSKAVDAVTSNGTSNYYATAVNVGSKRIRWTNHPAGMTNWGTTAVGTTFDVFYTAAVKAHSTFGASTSVFTVTAVTGGTAGNSITVAVTNGGVSQPLTVTVSGNAITVHAATDSGSAITSTAAQVVSAINAYGPAAALVLASAGGVGVVAPLSATAIASGANAISYVVILEGGIDANDTITDGEIQSGYDLFNTDGFGFALLLTAAHDSTVNIYCLTEISETLMNSVTFISPQYASVVNNIGSEVTDVVDDRNVYPSSSYGFFDGNWLQKYDKYNDVYRWIPANGDMAGLCALTDYTRDPWFSPAGLNRGNLKGVTNLAWNPKQSDRDILYQAGVNPIVTFPGQGPVLFGDKTMQVEPSAFDRINVRRLFIVIEQSIAAAAKYVLFEFNDDTTRTQFIGLVDPFLRDIQGRRGLYAYQIVCDASNNTPDVIDTNSFQGDIYLQPAKSINFINLNFIATRTGVNFSEIIGKF